jgi:integrase
MKNPKLRHQKPPLPTSSNLASRRMVSPRQPLTLEQIQAVETVADPELRGIIKVGRRTGHRLTDVARLRWRDADLTRRRIRIPCRKRSDSIVLPIPDDLHEYLSGLPMASDPDSPLFPTCCAMAEQNPTLLSWKFRRMQEKAGLRPWPFQSLRLTFVSEMMAAGVPQVVIRAMMGYRSPSVA